MADSLKIKFWGVRGSTPCANPENMNFGGNTTCFQVLSTQPSELLIIDCGTGIRNLGNNTYSSKHPLKGNIFITHPHWDHLQGFPFFKPFFEKEATFNIYLPPQNGVGCKEILQGHMSNTFIPVTMEKFDATMNFETFYPGELTFDSFKVDYMWAQHTVHTAIFRFKIDNKIIVFAPDNELPIDDSMESQKFIQSFRDFVKDADVLVHDAQLSSKQYLERKGWGHSTWERVLEVTATCNIKNLILTHHDPDSDDKYLENLDQEIKNNHSKNYTSVSLAREGQSIDV